MNKPFATIWPDLYNALSLNLLARYSKGKRLGTLLLEVEQLFRGLTEYLQQSRCNPLPHSWTGRVTSAHQVRKLGRFHLQLKRKILLAVVVFCQEDFKHVAL